MAREPDAQNPNGLRERVGKLEERMQALRERQDDQREDVTWLKRALWGLVFAVLLAVATYFIRLGATPPAG